MVDGSKKRTHLGSGVLTLRRELSVFINCPFDRDFRPIYDAIVFATVCCGFLPRSATESGSVSLPRMDRITRAMLSSKYSIHDLSRCRGEGDRNLARFNMPLELGIAMAQKYASEEPVSAHDWLLLVPRGHQYKQFISDMAAAYSWADLVLCRSGALTVSELAAAGVGALLVPFPHAVDDHQSANGRWLVAAGAAELIPEAGLDADYLGARLARLTGNRWRLETMAEAARALARPEAASRIVDEVLRHAR